MACRRWRPSLVCLQCAEVDALWTQCDPERENLCLYGAGLN